MDYNVRNKKWKFLEKNAFHRIFMLLTDGFVIKDLKILMLLQDY